MIKRWFSIGANTDVPPIVTSSIPLFGPLVRFGKDPVQFLQSCQAQFGDTFTLNFLLYKMTFLLNEPDVQSFFRAKEEDLDFKSAVNQLISGVLGPGTYVNDPAVTERDYVLIRKGFLRDSSVEKFLPQILDEGRRHFERWAAAGEFDLFPAASRLVSSINVRCIFGDAFMQEHGSELMQLHYEIERNGTSPLAVAFPSVPSPAVRKAQKARTRMRVLVEQLVTQRRQISAQEREQQTDYLQSWVDHRDSNGAPISASYLCTHIVGMLFAAHTNTAGTWAWTLAQLLSRPELYQQVLDEQDRSVIGDALTCQSLRQLDVLDRCMKESMRMHSPMMIVRKAARPVAFGKHTIPPGHLVCVSPLLMHLNPSYFSSPNRYLPERWTDEASRRDLMARNLYMQFGYGKHRCMGESFANVVLKTCWSQLLRDYSLELVGREVPPPDWRKAIGVPFASEQTLIRIKRRPRVAMAAAPEHTVGSTEQI